MCNFVLVARTLEPNFWIFWSQAKMTRMRQRIAQRLKDSQNTYAMLTTFNEVDMRLVFLMTMANLRFWPGVNIFHSLIWINIGALCQWGVFFSVQIMLPSNVSTCMHARFHICKINLKALYIASLANYTHDVWCKEESWTVDTKFSKYLHLPSFALKQNYSNTH